MPETVQGDRRQTGQPDQPRELVRHVGRMQRAAVELGEEQVRVDPGSAQAGLGLVLLRQMHPQDQHRVRVDRHDPLRRRCLRLALAGLPPVLHDLVGHLDRARVQVGVRTTLTTRLTPPQTGVSDQVEQRIEPVVDREVQELPGQHRVPHHHRIRHHPGLPPPRHPLRSPQHRLRPHRRRQLHQLRHVVRQQTLIDVRPQDRPQRLLDPMQRRRPDRTLPLHRRHLPRVAAGPVLGDQLVVVNDRLEHRVQMPDPQPVLPDLAQMRPQVQPDMRLVRAIHVPAHRALLPRQEPIEHHVHQRVLQHLRTGPDETTHVLDLGQWPLLRDQSREQVPDLARGLGVALLRDPEQVSHPLQPLLRLTRALVPAATPRPATILLVLRQLDPEVPLPVPLVRQLRTRITERLPVLVPAGTPPVHRSIGH
ncbi:hypothetical protein M8542_47785 [Amycolatopsis sp. OK19-0408]|uniref:Uncharacterized protein n=1 Tax=Amycolatopsis iheyensis TaxID=2945988 RepID=A0A9X2NQF5_9PSEU|nr:hypothetical protein [Amycolatopsis iheyensis]MCR6490530.1 hypothetical protein [Amycolatopsis iheyensis]